MGAYYINAQTIEHSILGCPSNNTTYVKEASFQIQIALQLFVSSGKKSYNFLETWSLISFDYVLCMEHNVHILMLLVDVMPTTELIY